MTTSHLPPHWTAQDVRGWLLSTFKSGRSIDVPLFRDLDLSVQIQRIFDDSPAPAQETLKAGTVLALREWRASAHGPRVLEDLCNLVALLKITAAIAVLDRIARGVLQHRPDSVTVSILSTVCGTVGGLAPGNDVELALRAIAEDQRCPAPLAGQLFIGLCRCRPDGYWEFVPRFRELRNRSREMLVNVTLAAGFADAVPARAILEGLKHLTGPDKAEVLWMIEHIPDRAIRTALTQGIAPPRTIDSAFANPTGSQLGAPDLANWFQQEAKSLSTAGSTINAALLRGAPPMGWA